MAAEGAANYFGLGILKSVNGAAAGWPRKAGSCVQRGWRAIRVNGAAAGWPRKAGRPFIPPRLVMLQWGRGRMAAEGAEEQARTRRATARQWGRGRMAAEG